MKVVVITSLYKPYSRGGAERVAEIIADGLQAIGHQVFVITTGPKLQAGGVYRFRPGNLFWFGDIHKYPALFRIFWHIIDVFNLHSYFVVKKILAREKPALVLTHNLKGIGYLVPRAIRRAGIKHIHTIHDVQLAVPSGIIKYQVSSIKYQVFQKLFYPYSVICRWLFGSPAVIISPSKWLANFYRERGFFKKSEIRVLPNPLPKTYNIKHETRRGESGLIFLYVGQMEEHKGVLFLIDTFKKFQIPNSKFQIRLRIVGAGSLLEKIKKLVQDNANIEILGPVYSAELDKIFQRTDFTIVPSLCYENSPTVIIQSFSHGVPVVAADIGGIPELVKDNENGFIFKAADSDSLGEALKKCRIAKDQYKKMSKNAFDTVQNYHLETYLNQLLNT